MSSDFIHSIIQNTHKQYSETLEICRGPIPTLAKNSVGGLGQLLNSLGKSGLQDVVMAIVLGNF